MDCPYDIEDERQIRTVMAEDMDAEVTATDTAGYVLSVRVSQDNISGEEFRLPDRDRLILCPVIFLRLLLSAYLQKNIVK